MEQLEHPNSLGLRFTTVYGPGARETMLIPKILKNDIDYLNVNHSRDFIHVDDVNAFHVQCLTDERTVGETFNLGMNSYYSLYQISEDRIADETER